MICQQKLCEDLKLAYYNNLWGKLVLSSPIIFDDNLKTASVLFSIADFNLSGCEFDSVTFKLLHCIIWYWWKIKLFNEVALNGIAFTKLL